MVVWKGRFRGRLDPEALAFSSSLPVDRRLYEEDIEGSIAHVRMLARQKILQRGEALRIEKALKQICAEIAKGKFDPAPGEGRFVADDVHMAIEQRLMEKIGPLGGKLHTARSRNDQVALDERLYLRKTTAALQNGIRQVQRALVESAEKHTDVLMPGYTHLQRAQPILLAHHLLSYVSMLERDHGRFADCARRANQSPLGAAAMAGTSFPIDREYAARLLKFEGIVENSIDAVSDRDMLIEFVGACAITMMHLSRFAEDMILWSSEEWHFAEIGEEFTTGSSIMPQKKNPDMAELIRGKAGRVFGDLIGLLTVLKGLPLSYNRDLQEDKEPLFDAADTLARSLSIFAAMYRSVQFSPRRFEGEADHLLATDLADYLVRRGMPFREAHAVVGAIVRESVRRNCSLKELPLKFYRRHSKLFDESLWQLLDVRVSLQLKQSKGSTAPKEVERALRQWRRRLGNSKVKSKR